MDYIHGQVINLGAHSSSDRIRPTLSKLIAAKQDFYDAHSAKEKRRLRFLIMRQPLSWRNSSWVGRRPKLASSQPTATSERAQKALAFVFEQIRDARGAKVALQRKALERSQSWFDDPDKPTFVWQLDLLRYSIGIRTAIS